MGSDPATRAVGTVEPEGVRAELLAQRPATPGDAQPAIPGRPLGATRLARGGLDVARAGCWPRSARTPTWARTEGMRAMARFDETITVNAPVEQVFAVARDIGTLWACYPGFAVRDVVLTPDGVGSRAVWYSKTLFLHQEGTVRYSEVDAPRRIVAHSSTGRVFTFTFTTRDDGGTDVGYVEEWSLKVPVIGATMENLAMRVGAGYVRRFMAAFTASLKAAVEGAPAPP